MDENGVSLGARVLNPMRAATARVVACTVLAGLAIAPCEAVTPASMRAAPHAVKFEGMPVPDALASIARSFGLRFKSTGPLGGTITGKHAAPNGAALLDRLAGLHGFTWFVHGGVLHASPTELQESARIVVGTVGIEHARSLVSGMQLLEERFGWVELPDEGVVHVSGPPDYVRLLRAALRPMSEGAQASESRVRAQDGRPEVMIFRLRNANAEDRTVVVRGQKVVMPGLASVLRNAVNGRPGTAAVAPPPMFDAAAEEAREFDRAMQQGITQRPGGVPANRIGVRSILRSRINIEADPRINAVLVADVPARRPYYERLIAELDVAQRLVEIEALIVDIDRTLLRELGVEWTVSTQRAGGSGVLQAVNGLPSTTFVIPDVDRFFARLRALDTTGQAAILGKPSVLTLDNQPAVIDLSSTEFIRLVGERAVDVREVTAGTMLRVVPRVLAGPQADSVQLLVDIEDGFLDSSGGRATPQVQRNTISTQALIDLGQSLVVGGYRGSQQRKEVNKVPLLGDLPLVGQAFRSTRAQDRNMERLFVITPRAIGAGTGEDGAPPQARRATVEQVQRALESPLPLEALFGGSAKP